MIKLRHDFSGDHWIHNLTKNEAYDISDKIEKYMREHDEWAGVFRANACEMGDSWSVYLRYRFNAFGVYSYADLYIKMREYDSQLKKIFTEAGIKLEEEL